jgi:hypothetical protein
MSFAVMAAKTPFLSSLLIFFCCESAKGVSYIIINMFIGVVADIFPRVR